MINILFEKLPEVLRTAIEKLQKSPYANSSPERRRALEKLMKQIEYQTDDLSKLMKVGDEGLTEEEKGLILKELDEKLRGE